MLTMSITRPRGRFLPDSSQQAGRPAAYTGGMPEITAIHVAPRKRDPVEPVAEAEAVAGEGLVGDRKFGLGRDRSITVVAEEELAKAGAELGREIVPGSTRRNVTVRGVELTRELGARYRLGAVEIEVIQDCAPCEYMEESVGPGARAALQGRAGIRGRIVTGGTLRVGDPVTRL